MFNSILGFGKWLFILPFAMFGISHFMNADDVGKMAPFGGAGMSYFTGACMLAFVVSAFMGKYDKLAAILLALFVLLCIVFIHVPAISSTDPMPMIAALKDLTMMGGAFMYAQNYAKDNSIVG
jgi:hypothetical protein